MKCATTALIATLYLSPVLVSQWHPAEGPLMTGFAKDVSPTNVHPEHPRPQLLRKRWQSLNELWEYAIRDRAAKTPEKCDGQILVPFPVESALSGVMKKVGEEQSLWYRRSFDAPEYRKNENEKVLLHFQAVDWQCEVWLNGKELGTHRGGYDPFTFDVTDSLMDPGPQRLDLRVWDPTDRGSQPRGKQVLKPRGIWYTAVTGIWQTVWLEVVPATFVSRLKLVPDVDGSALLVQAMTEGPAKALELRAIASAGGKEVTRASGRAGIQFAVPIENPRLWSPDDPFLYDLRLELLAENGTVQDIIESYFGLRKIEVKKDARGSQRLALNGRILYQHGPLDQGWWPGGLYTAPTDEALRFDLEIIKQLGFNMVRKHVKIEPLRWYYHCDRIGLLVWQDMPSGDEHARRVGNAANAKKEVSRTEESAAQFERELRAMIDSRHNHPCIVMWVPFNEGWGQYDTLRLTKWIKRHDPTRLVNCASGWNDFPIGDVFDIHRYPGPGIAKPRVGRASVLGEFGGLGLPVSGHTWQKEKNWGYRSFKDKSSLQQAFGRLIGNLRPLILEGLAASVYTQTTDVEIEVNGLMTYDRILKFDHEVVARWQRELYLPPPTLEVIVPTSEEVGHRWRFSLEPAKHKGEGEPDWASLEFDDSAWQEGDGGFGRKDTPGAIVRTKWESSEIRIRRSFDLSKTAFKKPCLRIHHDEDAEVYLNGKLIASLEGYVTGYVVVPLPDPALLRKGKNCLAIRCRQTGGGQYIDAGLVDRRERSGR